MTRLFPRTELSLSGSMISPEGCWVGVPLPLLFKAMAFLAISTFAAFSTSGVFCIELMASQAVRLPSARFRPGRITSSALGQHVVDVGGDGAEEEVVRSDTRRIVALMEHMESFGDRAMRHLPRNTMSPPLLSSSSADIAIAKGCVGGPHPARRPESRMYGAVLVNLFPESFSKRPHLSHDENIPLPCAPSYVFLGASA